MSSATAAAFFTHPLGQDAVLIPRTAQIADAYHAALVANNERLARWEPWAVEPPEPAGTRAFLERAGREWLAGEHLPVAIGVPAAEGGWRIVGSLGLRIDAAAASGELGYWVDTDFEGRGLVRRAAEVLIGQGFGPLGLRRIGLHTEVANVRSRALAERLGFTEEGVLRQAIVFPQERRDQVVYGLLAEDWRAARG
jgi:RimJ/RimL family protein N-acetyltransferase